MTECLNYVKWTLRVLKESKIYNTMNAFRWICCFLRIFHCQLLSFSLIEQKGIFDRHRGRISYTLRAIMCLIFHLFIILDTLISLYLNEFQSFFSFYFDHVSVSLGQSRQRKFPWYFSILMVPFEKRNRKKGTNKSEMRKKETHTSWNKLSDCSEIECFHSERGDRK